MRLEIHQDNSALYHWSLVTDDGRRLAKSSEDFATRDAAVQSAQGVREQAAAAPMEVS
jgi:uncharacterized protein YegP (UPF0339 family)